MNLNKFKKNQYFGTDGQGLNLGKKTLSSDLKRDIVSSPKFELKENSQNKQQRDGISH